MLALLIQFPFVQQYNRLLGKLPQPGQFQLLNAISYDSDTELPLFDPSWGNNWEASSSTAPQVPRCLIPMNESTNENMETESLEETHGNMEFDLTNNADQENVDIEACTNATGGMQLVIIPEDDVPLPIQAIPPTPARKRKSRKRTTPIVDDEIQRNTRQHQMPGFVHMELDEKSKPRKLSKKDTKQLKRQLELQMDDAAQQDQMLPIELMQDLAINYCEVPPKEVTDIKLLNNVPNDPNKDA